MKELVSSSKSRDLKFGIINYIYCGDRPKITGWALDPSKDPGTFEESMCLKPSIFKRHWEQRRHVQGDISPRILKNWSKCTSQPLKPLSQIREQERNTKYLSKSCHCHIECTTATLLATLMWRRPLNSATLATATHKELRGVSDGTVAQVRVQMIDKCKAQMIRKGLYNVYESP